VSVPDKPTQVMSLDELMDLAAEPPSDTVTAPIPAPLNPATPRPTPAPKPAAQAEPAVKTEPDMWERLVADAREWLKQGDNALIASTAAVAFLLLLVVAAL